MFKAILYGILEGVGILLLISIPVGGFFYIADAVQERYNMLGGLFAGGIYVSVIIGAVIGLGAYLDSNNTDNEI